MLKKIISLVLCLQTAIIFAQIAALADSVKPILTSQTVPNITLTDIKGNFTTTNALFSAKNTVLIFYRGGWCPYCNVHLKEVGDIEKNLTDLGYQVVAVSPDAPKNLQSTFDKDSLQYQLYSDSKTLLMQGMGIAFYGPEKYKKMFIDASNGDNTEGVLPVPSVFFVDKMGKIAFEYINPDYKHRISGKLILAIASALEMPVVEPKKDSVAAAKTVQVEQPSKTIVAPPLKKEISEDFNALLSKYVSESGKVNYKGLKSEKDKLAGYIKILQANIPDDKEPKTTKLPFWINAYNALTLKLIVDNYPLSKITSLDGEKPWDVKRYTFNGKKLSLNDIENNIIRPMGDPRIHFALNCAAKSCPPLLNQAFTTQNLETLLEQRTRQFINSNANILQANAITVSKIFDWYGKDFGSVPAFVAKYAKTKVNKTAKVSFSDYNWDLNE